MVQAPGTAERPAIGMQPRHCRHDRLDRLAQGRRRLERGAARPHEQILHLALHLLAFADQRLGSFTVPSRSLSPVLVAGVLASVRHLKASSEERDAQQKAAAYLRQSLAEAGLPVMASTTHIVPLMVGDPVHAKRISDILLAEYGVYVQPINYPTVPRGTERLRFTPGPAHTPQMMDELTNALSEIWDRMNIKKAA